MKKLVFLFVAFAAVSFASCGNKAAQTEEVADTTATEVVEEAPAEEVVADTTAAEAPADSAVVAE